MPVLLTKEEVNPMAHSIHGCCKVGVMVRVEVRDEQAHAQAERWSCATPMQRSAILSEQTARAAL